MTVRRGVGRAYKTALWMILTTLKVFLFNSPLVSHDTRDTNRCASRSPRRDWRSRVLSGRSPPPRVEKSADPEPASQPLAPLRRTVPRLLPLRPRR